MQNILEFNKDKTSLRARQLFQDNSRLLYTSVDKTFLFLLLFQWAGAITCSLMISPLAWEGASSSIHLHVWTALLLGAVINVLPLILIFVLPGEAITRHAIAFAQMTWSAFLIHLSGGRVETHFHIFGSLAFLAFYKDWRVLITATAVTAVDHIVRSFYWPESVYGINYQIVYGSLSSANWRWLEHVIWVLFCDTFLIYSCLKGTNELRELTKRQSQLEETSRLAEAANQAKSAFLANMSHELRTPMHGILSYARFGQTKIDFSPKEKIKSYFDEIHESGSNLMNLLNDLLDLTKLESGKVDYNMQERDLIDVTEGVKSELVMLANEKDLTIEILNTEPIKGFFDQEKIGQVVRNILSNAIKFSHRGSIIKVFYNQTELRIRCCVLNRGVGIPQAELETVFDKFAQSSKTKTGSGGTGLGLAICREIIQQHNGMIWAESDDTDTKFTFELPRWQNMSTTELNSTLSKTPA